MYCDSEKNYSPQNLSLLVEFIEHISDVVCLTWWKETILLVYGWLSFEHRLKFSLDVENGAPRY
jgi:hypothetical protein